MPNVHDFVGYPGVHLLSGEVFGILDLIVGDVAVIRNGPVIRAVPAPDDDDACLAELDPVKPEHDPDHPAVRATVNHRSVVNRIRDLLDESWHPWADAEHPYTGPGNVARSIILSASHDGLPVHWHDGAGRIHWFEADDDESDASPLAGYITARPD